MRFIADCEVNCFNVRPLSEAASRLLSKERKKVSKKNKNKVFGQVYVQNDVNHETLMLHLPDTVGELLGVGGENALPRIVAKETRRANVETSKIVHIPLRETVEPTITHTQKKKT